VAFHLPVDAPELLFVAADHLAGGFLHRASRIFEHALDVILVHGFTSG
jgi:hypothetical protein